MCGIYGVLSYKDKLKDMNELVDLLGMESAERGTDATGVAYSILGNMKINKSAVSAYKFNPNIPKYVNAVIGHTRHSTQGDKSKNYNNHPWSERVKNCQFALAHNGVLFNDKELQKKYNFKSKIETDSFVAVQLPAEFVIFHRPILPVDVFSIIIRRLITFVYKESMLQRVVCPFLFFFADSDFFQIDVRGFYVCTCAIVIKQSFGCILIFTLLMECFHFFQSRIVQIEK